MTKLDSRYLAALQIQLDALADQVAGAGVSKLNTALDKARKALSKSAEIMERHDLLVVPHDYKPPTRGGGAGKAE
jgi:hypothetical protein